VIEQINSVNCFHLDTCHVKSIIRGIIPICYDGYSGATEETHSFSPGWVINGTINNSNSSINQAFRYQTSDQLDTYVYLGEYATYRSGGYVYEFRDSLSQIRNDLSQLHQLGWIDRQTRAVLIQINLYNPNIPIFTSANLLIEILPSSGIYPSARFDPIDFSRKSISLLIENKFHCDFFLVFKSIFQIICVFIYLTFIIYFMIVEIYSFIHLKQFYFYQMCSYIELGIIVCSWTSVGIHIWRMNEIAYITNLFHQTHGNANVNLQLVAYINDLFSLLLGFCCFFGTLKLLRLYYYIRRLALLSNTLKRASRELISFSFMFAIIYMAFLTLFYLQFNSSVWNFATLLQTAQMLFEMLLLKFDARIISRSASFLGPFYFALFILFVVFVSMNMFVSIIIDNFRLVRADIHKVDRDGQDLFIRLIKKLHRWCGRLSYLIKFIQ
jgi:hypothetical protein